MDKDWCAPNVNGLNSDNSRLNSCFGIDDLREIAMAYNKWIKNKKYSSYKPINEKVIRGDDKTTLWKSIRKHLRNRCKDEACWSEQDFIDTIEDVSLRDKIKYFTFKPKLPKRKQNWLSTADINNVLQQYQEFDKTFKFLGALPSDFYEHAKVKYSDIEKYKSVGIVFNHDTHDKTGSHWVVLFIDTVGKTIEYFDSTGEGPIPHISKFINFLRIRVLPGYKYLQNTRVHQRKNSECGVYSIYYIVQRLLKYDFYAVTSNIISDDQMSKFRKYIFRQ